MLKRKKALWGSLLIYSVNWNLSVYYTKSNFIIKFPQGYLVAVVSQPFFCGGIIHPFKTSMFVGDRNIFTLHFNCKAMFGNYKAIFSPNSSGILKTLCGNTAFCFQFCKVHIGRYSCFLKGFPLCRYKRCLVLIFSTACNKLPAFIHITSLENTI